MNHFDSSRRKATVNNTLVLGDVMDFLSRRELADRWGVSQRFIDRRRQQGLIPWVDLALGIGKRPMVRFRLEDVEAFEQRGRLDVAGGE